MIFPNQYPYINIHRYFSASIKSVEVTFSNNTTKQEQPCHVRHAEVEETETQQLPCAEAVTSCDRVSVSGWGAQRPQPPLLH